LEGVSAPLRKIVIILASVVAMLAALAAITALGVAAIERAHPPAGRFVEVEGGRLHVLELGAPDAPPVVLLHGLSGNLGDMRLALGDRLAARFRVILIDRPGHGWSERPGGRADASPARQAKLIHQALEAIGVRRAFIVGHSWSGALAAAYALDHPQSVVGLVLLAPVTYPWPGNDFWLDNIITTPLIGPLFVHTVAYPIGKLLIWPTVRSVFSPQEPPADYLARAGGELILRPAALIANAEDILRLASFVAEQAPRYAKLQTPTVIITGDADDVVSPEIHAHAIAAVLPRGKLIVLPDVGHMVHFAAAEQIVQAIAELSAAGR
jgi:pimeloyl-ACP methyl ester carboxylesterase